MVATSTNDNSIYSLVISAPALNLCNVLLHFIAFYCLGELDIRQASKGNELMSIYAIQLSYSCHLNTSIPIHKQ